VIRFVSQSTQRQMIWVDIPRDATPAQRRVRYTLSSGGGLAEGKKGQQLNPPLVKCDNKGCLGSSFHFAFLTSCLCTIWTTLLLASRFDSIMALP
jgi:hypothetical protein